MMAINRKFAAYVMPTGTFIFAPYQSIIFRANLLLTPIKIVGIPFLELQ